MVHYTDIEIDALREFINTGTAHAATALSKLIDKPIKVNIPNLNIVPIPSVPEKLGGAENPIVGLYFRMMGDISGSVLLFFPQETAQSLLESLMAGVAPGQKPEFDEIGVSALMELGNIMTNSYINALAQMMDGRILISVPFYSSDLLGAVIDFLLIEIAQEADYALLMETVIESPEVKLKGNFIIFPNSVSLAKIFEKMGLR